MLARKKKEQLSEEEKFQQMTEEEKIEEMKLRPDGKSIMSKKYLLGDRDERTRRSVRQLVFTSIASLCIVGGIGGWIYGNHEYNKMMLNNTTPDGSDVEFTKSEVPVKVVETWTDKDKDLTVVRLNFSQASEKVSKIAKNYNLNIAYPDGHPLPKNFQMRFGFLGASDDAYLFLKGKMENYPYRIIISSHRSINQQNDDQNDVSSLLQQNGRIDKALENNQYQEDNRTDDKENDNKKNIPLDAIIFKVNPYSSNTHDFDGSFLNSDGSIDYTKVIENVSVKTNTSEISKQIENDEDFIRKAKITIDEYEHRVKEDPTDEESKSQIEDLTTDIKEKEKEIKMLQKQLHSFETSKFTESNFGDMQTKFTDFPDKN